jgi:hypothetical protein
MTALNLNEFSNPGFRGKISSLFLCPTGILSPAFKASFFLRILSSTEGFRKKILKVSTSLQEIFVCQLLFNFLWVISG